MSRDGSIIAFLCLALGVPALAQPMPSDLAPPIPTGVPLFDATPIVPAVQLLPKLDVGPELPWWIVDRDSPPPASLTPPKLSEEGDLPFHSRPWHPNPPPAAFAGSACNFNPFCGDDIFSPDFQSCQVLLGGFASSSLGPTIHSFNYIPLTLRAGWMLTAPDEIEGLFRGNWECLADLTIGSIFTKYGSCMFGPSLNLRRNFLWPGASIVPYTQVGAGFLLIDASQEKWQRAIGQDFEFQLNARIGCRYFISERWTLDIEGGLQHISNAGMKSRNAGVNALGGQIGFTYHFPAGVW